MNKLKTYQRFQLDSVKITLKKIIDFQSEIEDLRCLVSLSLNCGTIITGYPVRISDDNFEKADTVMIKDKVDEDLFYVLVSAISAIRIYNAPEFIQALSCGNFLSPIKNEDQITRFKAKKLIHQAWDTSQMNFSLSINWDILPNDDGFNNYIKDTVDGLISIIKEISKDELGRSSLKSISELKLEYIDSSEIKCLIENQSIVCKFNLQWHPLTRKNLKAQLEALL